MLAAALAHLDDDSPDFVIRQRLTLGPESSNGREERFLGHHPMMPGRRRPRPARRNDRYSWTLAPVSSQEARQGPEERHVGGPMTRRRRLRSPLSSAALGATRSTRPDTDQDKHHKGQQEQDGDDKGPLSDPRYATR